MRRPGHRTVLWLILAASLGLRLWLVAGGGQGYWPDENIRYGEARTAAYHLVHGEWAGLVRELFGHADHLLFRWIALPPALLDEWWGASEFRAAVYFSLFSTATIALIWGIVRRAGGDEAEALLAAGLAACANGLFFYARHFFPYDAALALMLSGLWVGLGGRQAWRAVAAGVAVGAGFLTYNGYWLPGATVLAAVVVAKGDWRRLTGRALLAGGGLLVTVGGVVLAARLAGHDLIATWQETAATITQGDFGRGWRVIAEYLWFTEGPLTVIWGAALAAGLWLGWRGSDETLGRWLGAVGLLFAGLVVLSDGVHKFVVYGRLVRPLAPFLCLVTARVVTLGIARCGWPDRTRPGLMALAAGCAVWSFSGPLFQVFPAEFLIRARGVAQQEQRTRPGVLQALRTEHLWGVKLDAPLPPHRVLLREAHPLQYRPYQYEGFSAAQREEFVRHDIGMRLIRLRELTLEPGAADALVPAPHFGPVRLGVRFPLRAKGQAEPLLATGVTRRGDILFVRYEDDTQVRFGLDHWGSAVVMSEPVTIDPAREYELILSMGSLFPEASAGSAGPVWTGQLRRLAFVALDGKPVFTAWSDFFPTAPGEASIASNFIGGSAARREFSGAVTALARVPLGELGRLLPFARLALADRGPDWAGAPGPWRLRLRLPRGGNGFTEPLFTVRTGTGHEGLLLERLDDTSVRLRLERAGGVYRSEPFTVDPAQVQEIIFSSGTLYPAEGSGFFERQPGWRPLQRLAYAAWNGRTVLLRNFDPLPDPAEAAALGSSVADGISAREHFSGLVETMEPVGPDEILRSSTQLAGVAGTRPADWAGYPGPVRLRLRFPREFPAGGAGEPLLVSGLAGAGDIFAVFYQADGRVRFSVDHWGAGNPPVSEPVRIEPGEAFELVVSVGFLWPPADAPLYQAEPTWRAMRQRVVLAVNGQTVLDAPATAHGAMPATLTVGVNYIGGSTATANFTGIIEQVQPADPGEVLRLRQP